MFSKLDPGEDESRWRRFFNPSRVDETIKQAIQFCWMVLPEDKRTVEEVEKQIRRIVERSLKDFREDADAFRKS